MFDVHADEHEAPQREGGRGGRGQLGVPAERAGLHQPEHAAELQHPSSTPSAVQARRGRAPNDGTCTLIFSYMNTFITPEAPYIHAARIWRTYSRVFIVCASGRGLGERR